MKKKLIKTLAMLLATVLCLSACSTPGADKTTGTPADETTKIQAGETTQEQPTSGEAGDEKPTEPSNRLEALIAHAENALMYGRNIEGALYPQLFVDGINIVTKEPTIWKKYIDDDVTENYISNLHSQSNLLKLLEGLTMITGDESYAQAAYDQIQIRFDTPGLVDDNGLLWAGAHSFIDVVTGRQVGTGPYHEVKSTLLPLEMYYDVDPEGTKRYVTAVWNGHIDFSNLTMNRHAEYNAPLLDTWNTEYVDSSPYVILGADKPFFSAGTDMIEMAYFLTYKTGDPIYQVWGERLLDKYIGITDKDTGLTGNYYGRQYDSTRESYDEFLFNFAGAEFVDAKGVDYRTLTEDDYEICGDTKVLTRVNVKAIQGYGVQTFLELYEMTGQQKLYDFIKGNMLGLVRYIYDSSSHRFKTPISTNGTDFNPGGNGSVLVAPRGGEYLTEGKTFVENETTYELVFKSLIDTVHMLKDEDAAERAELWEAARAWAKNVGLGDIGTAIGENVNVNLETDGMNATHIAAMISLYKYSGHQQYYDMAIKMADNILAERFNEDAGLFVSDVNAPYAKFNATEMYAVFCVEAMTQGMLDEIDLDIVNKGMEDANVDFSYRASDAEVFYSRDKIEVSNIDLGSEVYDLVLAREANVEITDVTGHADERAIRQMVALGVMEVDANGKFMPDAMVTRAELVQMVVKLFDLDNAEGLIDENLSGASFDGDKIVTREEMASIIVRGLKAATPEKTYYVADSLYRIQDADSIADWARDYADIATNYRLMVDITEDVFNPKANVTKSMVADVFQNLCRYIELAGIQSLTATVTPDNADFQIITWETSDNTVLEVDQQGRLYPLKTGEAVITATTGVKSAQIKVRVSKQEAWMIKEITLNGVKLEGFDVNTREYDINLSLGTTQIPEITAVSINGAPVEVKIPDAFPGTVELKVQGADMAYVINLDNTFVEYMINQDFNVELGTPYDQVTTDRYTWDIRSKSNWYTPYCTVVDASTIDPSREGGCVRFPYLYELGTKNFSRIVLDQEYKYVFGPEKEDMFLIFEIDIAVRNMAAKTQGFDIFLSPYGNASYFLWLNITENQLRRSIDGDPDKYCEESIRTLEDNRFYNVKIVVDEAGGTLSYYLDGELLEKDVAFFKGPATDFARIIFENPYEGIECKDSKAEIFFDNIKTYELHRNVVESTLSQEPAQSTE